MNNDQEEQSRSELTEAHHSFEKGLNSYAFFRLPDRSMSYDLVQETFMKTWSYLLRGGKIDVMKSFLYHVLNNLIVDEYRKHSSVSLDLLLEKGFEPGVDPTARLFNILDSKRALILIQRLPPKYQKVMRMRYVEDLSLKEMAIVTGLTRNALAVQVHRGLQKLKVLYNTPA